MASTMEVSVAQQALTAVIRRIRNRWRLKQALHGLTIVLGATLVAIVVAPWLMERFHFAPAAVVAIRLLAYGALAALAVRYLITPLRKRLTDDKVALYLEEHEPSLETVVVSAVDATATEAPASVRSPHFVARLVESAAARSRAVGSGSHIETKRLTLSGVILAGIVAVAVLLVVQNPTVLAGMNPVGNPLKRPFFITVKPGNAQVTRGGDEAVSAALHGFIAPEAMLVVRRDRTSAWERLPMTAGKSGTFELRLFDLRSPTTYYIEANGIKSEMFRFAIVDLPYVKTLALELHYPVYTNLPVEHLKGGDLAVLEGTTVAMKATTTMPVKGARIVLDGQRTIPMGLDPNGTLTASMKVTANGFYKIELQALTGSWVPGSLEYRIDMLPDQPPTVAFTTPGRDARITSVEELATEIEAADDYGVGSVVLKYAVNGGPEQAVLLHQGRQLKDVVVRHTISAEEFGLEPGDLLTYYAEATDNSGRHTAKTDIFMVTVRHLDNQYKKVVMNFPGGPGGRGKSDDGEQKEEKQPQFTKEQRELLSATFKVNRDRAETPANEFSDALQTLLLSQGKLRGQLDRFAKQFAQRGARIDAEIRAAIQKAHASALGEMQAAENALKAQDLPAAIGAEQRALLQLQHADAAYKTFAKVELHLQGGSSQSSSKSSNSEGTPPPEDLADLFGLKDQEVRNRAETQRGGGGGGGGSGRGRREKVDALAEKLKRLAARVEKENERMRHAAQQASLRGGKGNSKNLDKPQQDAQQQQAARAMRNLAEEAEQLAQQVQAVAKDRPADRELPESARQLQQVAADLRRAAAQGQVGTDLAAAAAKKITDARELLERVQATSDSRDADAAVRLAEAIAAEERTVEQALQQLPPASSPDRAPKEQALQARKENLAGDVETLEAMVEQIARQVLKDNAAAAGKFRAVGVVIRQSGLADLMRYSKGIVSRPFAIRFEQRISQETEKLPAQVADAAAALRKGMQGREAVSDSLLAKARDLVRSAESINERRRMQQDQQPGRGQGQSQGQGKGQSQGQGQGKGKGQEYKSPPSGQEGGKRDGESQGSMFGSSSFRGRNIQGREAPHLTNALFTSDYRALKENVQALQREMKRRGLAGDNLNGVIEKIEDLEKADGDKAKADGLDSSLIEDLKTAEFLLRRTMETNAVRPVLGGNADVPRAYKAWVAEYYRSLAERP